MKKATLICQRQFNEHLVDGQLTLLSDTLHFEAHYPNKQRFSLPLHSILGISVQESICLLLLTKTGIVRFFTQLNESEETLRNFAQIIREDLHRADQSFAITSDFEFFLELEMGNRLSRKPCSVVLKKDALLIYSEQEETKTLQLSSIRKNRLTWSGLVKIKTQDESFYFLGKTAFQLYALIEIYRQFGEKTYIRTWTDYYVTPFRLALDCFVVQTDQHIHIYPPHFWLLLGVKPFHITTSSIHELEFQTTYLSIHAGDLSVSLQGVANLGFYRKSCEHIAKSTRFFFQGQWRDIQEKLPAHTIETGEVMISSASLWRHDRHILKGYLILEQDILHFLPLSDQMEVLTLPLSTLIRQDDKSTAPNILYIRDQESIYQFICPEERFILQFHRQTRLPNRRIIWDDLTSAARHRTINKQRALLKNLSHPEDALLVELSIEEGTILADILTTSSVLPRMGTNIQVSFTNSSGRHFFLSEITYIPIQGASQLQLQAPDHIALYSERETKRYSIGTTISLAPLEHNPEREEWLPLDEVLIGTLIDISETGCGITLSIDQFEYSRILIEIPITPPLQLVGEVTRVQSFIQGGLRLGICFISDTPSVRIQLQQIIAELNPAASMRSIGIGQLDGSI